MGIQYDPSTRKWNVIKLKTDYDQNRPIQNRVSTRSGGSIGVNEQPVETGYADDDGAPLYRWGNYRYISPNSVAWDELKKAQETAQRQNQYNADLNAQAAKLNQDNLNVNQTYDKVIGLANTSQAGDYTKVRDQIRALNTSQSNKEIFENNFKTFYRTERLQKWDPGLSAKPLYGDFDPKYYKQQNPLVAKQWADALANDDLDITERYGEEGFYAQHYTTQGKQAGLRGNAAEIIKAATEYVEKVPTDKDIQDARDLQLGIAEDQNVSELEDVLGGVVSERLTSDAKRFGALSQNILKDTIAEIKKAQQNEMALSLIKGFGNFQEITDVNESIANAMLGDKSIGGVAPFVSSDDQKQSLLKELQGISGVQNNATYNWQTWFNTNIKEKYSQAQDLGFTTEQANEIVKVDADFARQFIEKYLQPRFDQSRSMNEFIDSFDATTTDSNVFQTQDMLNAVKQIADLRSKEYLNSVSNASDRYFDSNFYFNPTGDKAREADYLNQSNTISKDWEDAKRGDPYWAAQAYRFGIDLNNKDQFAKMHFQIKGQAQGFDAAEDIWNAGKISDEIYNKILPVLKDEALKQPTVFSNFMTSEEALKAGSAGEIRSQIQALNDQGIKPTQENLGSAYIERPEDYKAQAAKPQTELYGIFQKAGYRGSEDDFYTNLFPDLDRSEQSMLTNISQSKPIEAFTLKTTSPTSSIESSSDFFKSITDDKDVSVMGKPDTETESYLRLGLEDENEGYEKSKSATQILNEFTSMFKTY